MVYGVTVVTMNLAILVKLRSLRAKRTSREDSRDDELKLLLLTTIIIVYVVVHVSIAVSI